jgi:zinc transport system permease protein
MLEGLLDDFMVRAAFAGVGVALAAAPLGCFVVWRRMAYFGDATAHAAVLGVALSLTFSTPIFAGVLVVSLLMAALVTTLSGRGFAMDTLLGVMAHSSLAVGLVAVSFLSGVRIDLMAYLFGDILSVSFDDLMLIWSGAAIVFTLVVMRWSGLLLSTMSPDLAHASVIHPSANNLS